MAFEFRLPDIGEGVIEGEVVRWLVKEGDPIREDQPMVEVMTDKATVEIPSPRAGRVARIAAPEGKTCAVGQVMVVIEEKSSAPPLPPAGEGRGEGMKTVIPSLAEEERQMAEKVPAVESIPAPGGGDGSKVLATPATRKLARDLGIDIARVRGTGDGGRVTPDDVRAAAGKPAPAPAPREAQVTRSEVPRTPAPPASPRREEITPAPAVAGDERIPFRGVRKKIAENMARSTRTAAHFTYVEEADLTELVALRQRAKKRAEERGIKLSFLPFIVKAVVAGLKKYPIVNSTLDEEKGEIVLRRRYHIGVATASEAGLIVPVVRDADTKSLFDIGRELGELADKAKAGKAAREELIGSTFTISSLGALGGVLATPIINHPEVAILGVHKIKPTPVVRDGAIVIREMSNFSISLDHRVVDGYEGAQFLAHVIALLEDPTLMFMELV